MLSNKPVNFELPLKALTGILKARRENKEKISHYHLHFYQYQVVIINNSSLITPNIYRCWLVINHAVRALSLRIFFLRYFIFCWCSN